MAEINKLQSRITFTLFFMELFLGPFLFESFRTIKKPVLLGRALDASVLV